MRTFDFIFLLGLSLYSVATWYALVIEVRNYVREYGPSVLRHRDDV